MQTESHGIALVRIASEEEFKVNNKNSNNTIERIRRCMQTEPSTWNRQCGLSEEVFKVNNKNSNNTIARILDVLLSNTKGRKMVTEHGILHGANCGG